MKKAEGYVIRKLEEEYVLIPCGERAEEMNETISWQDWLQKNTMCQSQKYWKM